jgi:tetratricopeptide (TPR) repeat protein
MPETGDRSSHHGSSKLRVAARASAAAARIESMLERLEGTHEVTERAAILVEIAIGLRDELGDRAQAADALLEALGCDPTRPDVLDHLEPLLREAGRFPEALSVVEQLVPLAPDAPRALACAEIVVRWMTRELAQPELARQWVERIRAIDTTHWLVHLVDAAVARERGDVKRELDELDFAVLSAKRKDDRARIHLLMAARYREERTKNLAEAKKHYTKAHKLLPREMEPLQGLEQLAELDGDKIALADVLRRQAEADVAEPGRVAILVRLAELEASEFKKPEAAARTFERALALAPADVRAVDGLERCLTAARAWSDLASALERGAANTADPAARAARLKRLGDVLESKLGDVRAAIATYQRLAELFPDDETVLGELARLAEKVSDVRTAVRCRQRLAELAPDPATRARMHVIAGQLLVPTDPASARVSFERAARADPTSASAWNALLWDARAEGDTARALGYLEERAYRSEMPRARAAAFVELAEARARAADAAGALRAYEEAAHADPTNEIAAGALVDAYVAAGRNEEADALAGVAIAAAERDRDYERLFALRRAETTLNLALGRPDRALLSALAAHDVRGDELGAKESLIAAAVEMRADPQVLVARDALVAIAERPDGLSIGARVGLAEVLALTGDGEHAAALYDAVLVEDPANERALRGLSQHHTASGNPIAALSLRRQHARGIEDEDERFAALSEIAEAFAQKAKNDELAAEVYEEARRIRPGDLPVLHRLLGLHQKLARWASVYDVLRSIADADADPVRKAKTLFAMAQLAKSELADRGAALALYDQVLDADTSQLAAFERIARMLTEDKDWLGLEAMYKKMLLRALGSGDVKLQQALYKQVAVLYRDRLANAELAIQALQAATHLRPDDDEAQTMLRELLSRTGQTGGAVAITLERVLRDPLDPAPYPALFDLLVAENARDRAVCVAQAMRFLGIPHAPAEGLRAAYPQPPLDGIVMDLGPEGYRELLHPELDPHLTEIFEVVAPALVELVVARLSLRERLGHPGPALKGEEGLTKMVGRAAQILGVPSPRLYRRPTAGPALAAAPTRPPSLLVDPQSATGIPREALTFMVGKRVAQLTAPLLARALVPSISELKGLGSTAARIAADHLEPGDQPLRERLKKEDVARISDAVSAAMSASGKLDVLRWAQLADVSASRAGLLLAGDLEAARAATAIEAQSPGDLTPREKMRELATFFLGDTCAALRRRLGVALR